MLGGLVLELQGPFLSFKLYRSVGEKKGMLRICMCGGVDPEGLDLCMQLRGKCKIAQKQNGKQAGKGVRGLFHRDELDLKTCDSLGTPNRQILPGSV